MTKFLPLPNINDMKIPEARKWMDKSEHTRLYAWGPDFMNMEGIWSGLAHWADGKPLEVVDGLPPARRCRTQRVRRTSLLLSSIRRELQDRSEIDEEDLG